MSDTFVVLILSLIAAALIATPQLYVFWAKGTKWKEIFIAILFVVTFTICSSLGLNMGLSAIEGDADGIQPLQTQLTVSSLVYAAIMIYLIICWIWMNRRYRHSNSTVQSQA